MKKILIILGILVFINIIVVTVSKVFAHEAGVSSSNLYSVKVFSI